MEKKVINSKEYDDAIAFLAKMIKKSEKSYDNLYPVPRGGYYAAIKLSEILGLPVTTKIGPYTLIVDDICDTGNTLSRYSKNDTACVYCRSTSVEKCNYYSVQVPKGVWVSFPEENGTSVEENIVRVLEYIGENPNREGLVGTPDRIVRMWGEIFRGYDESKKPKITVFENGVDGICYDNMVIDTGDFYSMCEHHAMPFFGKYWFAYIPNPKGKILGISKIGRVVDYCAARLQIQERLVHDVVAMLEEALGTENPPLGIALIMEGEHLCKTMRGAKKKGTMKSSHLTGVFKTDFALRAELMNLIGK